MARQTSIETYREIEANGLLNRRRWEIYAIVFEHGPMSSAEAYRILNHNKPTKAITSSRARFTELRDLGVFRETGTKFCSVTGRNVIEWDVTKNLPRKILEPKKIKCKSCNGKGYHLQETLL